MYIAESPLDGATGCMNCDTTDNLQESPYRLISSKETEKITISTSTKCQKRKTTCCNSVTQTAGAVVLIIISVAALTYPPTDFMLWEKLNMRPGLPPFDWWADPPDEVKARVYVFNITNHERFMAGLDLKMNVQEIGPIVYLEKLTHTNIRFNDNDTLTYTSTRSLKFLPADNTIDLNATLIVPNMAVLGLCSYMHSANVFVRSAIKYLMVSKGSELFVRKTIYQFLWDFNEPVTDFSGNLAPGLLPTTNLGILNMIYYNFVDEVTVKIGPKWGHDNFFKIVTVRGNPQFGLFSPELCPERLIGSTEGVMYPQYLKKQDVLLYLRKSVCKLMPLYFDAETKRDGVPVYRYNLTENVFDRVTNGTDCYKTDPPLPNGVSDTSKCFFNLPLVASYPHFYTGSPPKDTYVTGMEPDRNKHNSYIYVEPKTGTPFESVARMQCNLRVHDISNFRDPQLDRFSNTVIPLSWIEYKQENLPDYMKKTIYFMIVVLPPLSTTVFGIIFIITTIILLKKISNNKFNILKLLSLFKQRKIENLKKQKTGTLEKEVFIRNSYK